MRQCGLDGCEENFEPIAHNQKYHSAECRKTASDIKISERYYRLKKSKLPNEGFCIVCEIKLSRYNKTVLCSTCRYKQDNPGIDEIIKDLS